MGNGAPANCAGPHAVSFESKLAALRSPATHGAGTREVQCVETHFAWVFLSEHYAYKIKKPYRYMELDLSTLIARRKDCNREVQLNRRLAPEAYLGVAALTCDDSGHLAIAGVGAVVDWLVWMKRLPADLMLDYCMRSGRIPVHSLLQTGKLLARFYQGQPSLPIAPAQYIERIRERLRSDQDELSRPDLNLSTRLLQQLEMEQRAAIAAIAPELTERAREARIVDGHGDLRPEHICLSDPPVIIDALEFSDELRILDPVEELAFLRLECEMVRCELTAYAICAAYRDFTRDSFSERLLDFYSSCRAIVRAKLTAWHLRDPVYRERDRWVEKAENYLERAVTYARQSVAK